MGGNEVLNSAVKCSNLEWIYLSNSGTLIIRR